MLIEKIIKKNLPEKIPNIIFFNNFSEDTYDIISNLLINRVNKDKSYEIIKIINKIDNNTLKEINDKIIDINFFDKGKIFIIFNCSNIKNLKKIFSNKEYKNHFFFIFINFKSYELKELKGYLIIEYPKNLQISRIVIDYFNEKHINIQDDVIKMFDTYFFEYNIELENILEKIYLFIKEKKINILDKEIAKQFLFLSNQVVYFELSELFFKKQIKKFILLYKEFVLQQNSFEKFLYVFSNEVKLLLIISSLIEKNDNENYILSNLNNIGINYSKYRLKYDKVKINNFGQKKLKELFSFLLYCDYSLRRYQKNNVQLIFEVKILDFNK